MSGTGGIGSWFDPYGDDADVSTATAPGPIGSVNGSLGAPGGLFGSGWDATYGPALNAINWSGLLPPIAANGDGTGLPPSATVAPNLPQLPAAMASAPSQTPFNLYDAAHNLLNTPIGSDSLQFAQNVARSFEDNGDKAALVGLGGAGVGALTLDPGVVLGSLGLAALGTSVNEFGKGLDAGTSFLKSIQQDNSGALNGFGVRAATPDFTDLVPGD